MQTRDQRYAARIFERINDEIANRPRTEQKKYGSMAHKLPVLIRTAGLAQALAFVDARGDPLLLDHLARVIDFGTKRQLLDRSRSAELPEYMYLTEQALAALLWFKRFAQSVLDVSAEDEGDAVASGGAV